MKTKIPVTIIIIATFLLSTTSSSAVPSATPLGTAFTYQGRLDRDGTPYTGTCDFQFKLYDAATDGIQIGSTDEKTDLLVSHGLFATQLDFGSSAFYGDARWLEIAVQCPGDLSLTIFARQELTATPYALFANSVPWSGISGRPAGLDDGDNDTTYTNGYGLYLSGDTFSVNSDEVQFRVIDNCPPGSSLRAIYEDGTASCETDDGMVFNIGSGLSLSAGTLSIDPAYTQRRVNNSCAVGNSIRVINADGTVICQAELPVHQPYDMTIVDASGNVGEHTSIIIGMDGLGLISYHGVDNHDLKVAHCNDISCASATPLIIHPTGNTGQYTSITIGADGLGLISFQDGYNKDLLVAHCIDTACSSISSTILDSTGEVGEYSSITIGADGLGLISYYDYTNGDLKVAHCEDINCTGALMSTLDTPEYKGGFTSLTIGADGLGLIAYTSLLDGDLKVAHCDNINCTTATYNIIDSTGVAYFNSMTTGTDGLGLISYHDNANGDLKVAHCNDSTCSDVTVSTLDSLVDVGSYSSITIGSDGLGLISYRDDTNANLKLAHCVDIICSSATSYTLDSTDDVGTYTSITIGSDGFGLITYYDITNGDLKVVHCSNALCIPYFRRR